MSLKADEPFFKGKILYEYSFKNPYSGEDISERLRLFFGSEHHYYIKDNNYKSTNEIGQLTTLYQGETNTFYQMGANNTAQRFDGKVKSAGEVKIIKLKKIENILGHDCKVFVLKSKQRKITYYYAEDIKVNKDFFAKHHLGNWSDYIEASEGALPLKYVVETQDYIWVAEAIEIIPMDLPEREFTLPQMVKVKR